MPATLRLLTIKLKSLLRLQPVAVIGVVALIVVITMVPTNTVGAQSLADDIAAGVLSWISWGIYYVFVTFMGVIADMLVQFFLQGAAITGFTTLPAVQDAWATVRDLSNMFFIVILMFIAFGTLLNIEAYSWKQLLPKMVMAAILVNFSLAIVGLVVDATQIVMLTFVEAIKPAASQGFVTAFQLNSLVDFNPVNPADTGATVEISRLISIIVAGVMLSTLVMVTMVYMVLVVGRLAMIWFLAVLSPLAFTMMVLPSTEKYFQQWFEILTRYAILGPLMLFFMWLSLFIAARSATTGGKFNITTVSGQQAYTKDGAQSSLAATGVLAENGLLVSFVLSIMMLMAGLKLSQDSASEMSSYVGKAAGAAGWFGAGAIAGYAYNSLKDGGVVRGAAKRLNNAQMGFTNVDLSVSRWSEGRKAAREEYLNKKIVRVGAKASSRQGLSRQFGASYDHFKAYGLFYGTEQSKVGVGGLAGQYRNNFSVGRKESERDEAANELATQEKAYEDRVAELSTRKDKSTKLKELNQTSEAIDAMQKGGAGAASGTIDLTKDSASRLALQRLYDRLNEEYEDVLKNSPENSAKIAELATKKDAAANMIKQSNEGIAAQAGTPKAEAIKALTVDAAIKGDLEAQHQIEENRLKAEYESINGASSEVNGVQAETPEQLRVLIDQITKPMQESLKAKQDEVAAKTREIAQLRPSPTMTARRKTSQLMEEATKDIDSTNENELVAIMTKHFDNGNNLEGLAIARYLSKVGHSNEIISQDLEAVFKKKFKGFKGFSDRGAKGIKEFSDTLIKEGGLDDQMVYGVIDDIARNSQQNNHWTYAQLIGMQNGKRVFRTEDQYQQAQFEEARKYSASGLAKNGNRLAIGDYDMQGNYRLAPHLASFVAENFHTFGDMIKKSMFSDNMSAWMNQDDTMRRMIIEFSPDAEEALKQYDLQAGTTYGPASTPKSVMERTQRANRVKGVTA